MQPKQQLKPYYFVLAQILKERGLTKEGARRKYGFNKKDGPYYISRTGFGSLCSRPKLIGIESDEGLATLSRLCLAMDLPPGAFFRQRK